MFCVIRVIILPPSKEMGVGDFVIMVIGYGNIEREEFMTSTY